MIKIKNSKNTTPSREKVFAIISTANQLSSFNSLIGWKKEKLTTKSNHWSFLPNLENGRHSKCGGMHWCHIKFRQNVIRHKTSNCAKALEDKLFVLSPILREALLQVRKNTFDMMETSRYLIFISRTSKIHWIWYFRLCNTWRVHIFIRVV